MAKPRKGDNSWLPVVDLAATVRVIDDSGKKLRWKILARLPAASAVAAKRVLKRHGLAGGFMVDSLGGEQWVSAD